MARNQFKKGDHLRVDHGPYYHEGVYSGGGCVVHYSEPQIGAGKENAVIRETSLKEFAGGGRVSIDPSTPTTFSPDQIVQRARSRIGESDYHLLQNNCEHFVAWVRTGEATSDQVNRAVLVGGAALYFGVHKYGWEKVVHAAATACCVALGVGALQALARR